MDPELRALLDRIEAARERGADTATLDRAVSAATGGRIANVGALRAAASGPAGLLAEPPAAAQDAAPGIQETPAARTARIESRQDAALRRESERGNSPVSDFGRLAFQGATFGFGDELIGAGAAIIPGGRTGPEALRESRQRVQDLRTLNPGAALAAEAAGAVPTVGFSLLRSVIAPTTAVGRVGLSTGVGAAEGAAFGAGEADPDPDLPIGEQLRARGRGAVVPAAVGGGVGGLLGTAGAVASGRRAAREVSGTGGRVADAAREAGDLSTPSATREGVQARKAVISERHFGPLEELGPIEHAGLRETLDSDAIAPVVKQLFPEVAEGTAPTFRQLQSVRKRFEGLRERAVRSGDTFEVDQASQAHRQLTEAIGESVEGFETANKLWQREAATARALDDGRRLASKPADDIVSAYEALPDNTRIRAAFRNGLAVRMLAQLDDGQLGKRSLNRILEGAETRAKWLTVFDGDEAALREFTEAVQREESLRTRAAMYNRLKRDALLTVAGGGAGGVVVKALLD